MLIALRGEPKNVCRCTYHLASDCKTQLTDVIIYVIVLTWALAVCLIYSYIHQNPKQKVYILGKPQEQYFNHFMQADQREKQGYS